MIANKAIDSSLNYRQFRITIKRTANGTLTTLRWENLSTGYVGVQTVASDEWTEGEILRFAMDCVDQIWNQWNRVELQKLKTFN